MKPRRDSSKARATGRFFEKDKIRTKLPAQLSRDPDVSSVASLQRWGYVMKNFYKAAIISLALWPAIPQAVAEPDSFSGLEGANQFSSYMRIYGPANPPYGFVRYCNTNPQDCTTHKTNASRVKISRQRYAELQDVNSFVNATIEPKTDIELHGVSERWSLPTTSGDCEDFALLKQKMLHTRGWPMSALLLTVVRDELGDGHAVLTVRTAEGDFILDNKRDEILVWTKTEYDYLMRQSYLNPKIWVSLDWQKKTYSNLPVAVSR